MNPDPQSSAPLPELPEPTFGKAGLPMWPVLMLAALFFGGQLYLETYGGGFRADVYAETLKTPPPTGDLSEEEKLMLRGAEVYKLCSACHQPNGMGTPGQFPPLAGSDWVLAEGPNRVIRIVLDGVQGPIKVKVKDAVTEWNNAMVPWRDPLSDADIAAVTTFIRRNKDWGHNASLVKPAQVKAIREATSAQAGRNYSADELLKVPEQ
ncbi:MAG: cytochrome c [Verrucomicrobia bacterium]|nr:cytochrome c [Verrucomicrobiota bacterium]